MQKIFGVYEITEKIKYAIEQNFTYIWVKGEISNISRPSSGHLYFQLKDKDAILPCVWFKGRQIQKFNPLTGEVLEAAQADLANKLENGIEIICSGQVSLYQQSGSYQLIVDQVENTGDGLLHQELEKLKAKLYTLGYFSHERKRKLERHPTKIALITSAESAALQDFLRIANNRGFGAKIKLYPVQVQGLEAPNQIIRAIEMANSDLWEDGEHAQIIAIIRGGGSKNDLHAFNDEGLAKSIFTSQIPVITGIGHEIDTSIADLVADVKAATPSHVAQIIWLERDRYVQHIDELELKLAKLINTKVSHLNEKLNHINSALSWLSPVERLKRMTESLDFWTSSLQNRMNFFMDANRTRLDWVDENLENYIVDAIKDRQYKLQQSSVNLQYNFKQVLSAKEKKLLELEYKLENYNPLSPLERGYALIRDGKNNFLKSVNDAKNGEKLKLVMHDGAIETTVNNIISKNGLED